MIIDHSGAPTARQVRTWPRRDLGLRHIPFFSYEHLRHPTVHDTERPSNLQAIRYPLARVRLSLCTYCVLRWTRRTLLTCGRRVERKALGMRSNTGSETVSPLPCSEARRLGPYSVDVNCQAGASEA